MLGLGEGEVVVGGLPIITPGGSVSDVVGGLGELGEGSLAYKVDGINVTTLPITFANEINKNHKCLENNFLLDTFLFQGFPGLIISMQCSEMVCVYSRCNDHRVLFSRNYGG